MRALALLLALTGCASQVTHYAGDPAYSCGKDLEPRQYCANFETTAELRKDPTAVRAKLHCLGFYAEAIRATKLLCSYFEEMDSLTSWGEGDDSPTVSAKGKRIHRRYKELAEIEAHQLEVAYTTTGGRGARGSDDEMSYDGRELLEAEMGCQPKPGRAPGLLLLGVSAQARHDEKVTFDRLEASLAHLKEATSLVTVRPYLALRDNLKVDSWGGEAAERSVAKIVSSRLDEPALLALGVNQVPKTPELQRYYAEAVRRAKEPAGAPVSVQGGGGRSLASVRCPRDP